MHLACHLEQCVLDYGPIHAFWCFGFERFNGILGSFPNNNQNVAITMMKKFEDYLRTDVSNIDREFKPLLSDLSTNPVVGSLSESDYDLVDGKCKLLKPLREYVLPARLQKHLVGMYEQMFSTSHIISVSEVLSCSIQVTSRHLHCHKVRVVPALLPMSLA